MEILKRIKNNLLFHAETIIAIPVGMGFLFMIAMMVKLWVGNSLSEDVESVAKYAIRGVGLLIAGGVAIGLKSRGAGDVDENSVSWPILLIDSLSLWIFFLLSLLAIFGSSLWL